MTRLDDLRQLEAELSAVRPSRCGCVHELISFASGKVQFCPSATREANAICFHRKDTRHFSKLLGEAARLNLLNEEEEAQYLREAESIRHSVQDIDVRARDTAQSLALSGDLLGITDFSQHWLANETRDRQRSNVEDVDFMIDTILGRIHSEATGITDAVSRHTFAV
jgi:hypothetical protein